MTIENTTEQDTASTSEAIKASPTAIRGFKGYDKDLRCQPDEDKPPFQYEIGGIYETDKAVACKSGFHYCEYPLDIFNYKPLIGSRFTRVIGDGEFSRQTDKICSSQIFVGEELSLKELIIAQVELTIDKTETAASGYKSQLAASGNGSRLAASGDDSQLAASGDDSQLAASGDYSRLAASGDDSQLAASGNGSRLAASGDCSRLAASGDYSQLAASGNGSQLSVGDNGFASVASINGNIQGGAGSALSLGYIDSDGHKRIAVAYVGEDGIAPNVWYKVNDKGEFIKA